MKANPQLDDLDRAVGTGVAIVPARIECEHGQNANSREPQAGVATVPTCRIWALDFTKGALVIFMVLYHWLNYFVGPHGFFYRYLIFLPPSFICISGFLISQVYLKTYEFSDPRLPRRLFIRGLKLFGMFVSLNVMIVGLVIARDAGGNVIHSLASPANLWSIFVSKDLGGVRPVSFYILAPISYMLILSASLVVARRYFEHVFHIATGGALVGVAILYEMGRASETLELLSIGLLGISIGYISIATLDRMLKRPYILILGYMAYLIGITMWSTPYPLEVAGVIVTLTLLYRVGVAIGRDGHGAGLLALLGKYSLVAYIVQIVVLRLVRWLLQKDPSGWTLVISFVIAVSSTVFAVIAVDRSRSRLRIVNTLYRAVFC